MKAPVVKGLNAPAHLVITSHNFTTKELGYKPETPEQKKLRVQRWRERKKRLREEKSKEESV